VWLANIGGTAEQARTPAEDKAAESGCERKLFEDSAFTACRYDARRHRIEIFVDDGGVALRSFARLEEMLGPRGGDLVFAMNAGMYDEDGLPIGLYVEAGRRKHAINLRDGPGNFHLKPNGIFAGNEDGKVAIVASESWGKSKARVATQSGPMLVIGGRLHPKISADGDSLHIRNGACTSDGRGAWFAISEEPVSFGRMARFFRDGLGCRDALYFDGAVSSLWDPVAGRRDDGHAIGPMIAVFRRP
jgi:uncharacterized protein YigE (DUF2233 family)